MIDMLELTINIVIVVASVVFAAFILGALLAAGQRAFRAAKAVWRWTKPRQPRMDEVPNLAISMPNRTEVDPGRAATSGHCDEPHGRDERHAWAMVDPRTEPERPMSTFGRLAAKLYDEPNQPAMPAERNGPMSSGIEFEFRAVSLNFMPRDYSEKITCAGATYEDKVAFVNGLQEAIGLTAGGRIKKFRGRDVGVYIFVNGVLIFADEMYEKHMHSMRVRIAEFRLSATNKDNAKCPEPPAGEPVEDGEFVL